jgi:hypothetical protein
LRRQFGTEPQLDVDARCDRYARIALAGRGAEWRRLVRRDDGVVNHRLKEDLMASTTLVDIAGSAHHGDDLLDRRRVSRVLQALVAGWSSLVIAGQGR